MRNLGAVVVKFRRHRYERVLAARVDELLQVIYDFTVAVLERQRFEMYLVVGHSDTAGDTRDRRSAIVIIIDVERIEARVVSAVVADLAVSSVTFLVNFVEVVIGVDLDIEIILFVLRFLVRGQIRCPSEYGRAFVVVLVVVPAAEVHG